MPVLLHRVAVALDQGPVIISWTARQALMRRLQHVQSNAQIRATFSAVGTSRPVELRPGQRTALLRALEAWSLDLDGYEPIPQDLLDLRDALIADLHGGDRSVNPIGREVLSLHARTLDGHRDASNADIAYACRVHRDARRDVGKRHFLGGRTFDNHGPLFGG